MVNENLNKKQLLWIDDEFTTLPWLFKQLSSLIGENNLKTARTSQEARRILRKQEAFNCLLLDIMLPRNRLEFYDEQVRLDEGISLLEDLRNAKFPAFPPGTPIVIFTARGNEEALERIQKLLAAPNDKLLRKAIDSLDDVLNSVKQALQAK